MHVRKLIADFLEILNDFKFYKYTLYALINNCKSTILPHMFSINYWNSKGFLFKKPNFKKVSSLATLRLKEIKWCKKKWLVQEGYP